MNDITIPETVEEIGEHAYFKCMNMEYIRILNPDCVIKDDGSGNMISTTENKPYDGTVYGYTGSTAEAYAQKYAYSFESLDSVSTTTSSDTTLPVSTTPAVTTVSTSISSEITSTMTVTRPEYGQICYPTIAASVGDTIAVPIELTVNPGIAALSFEVSYLPDALELLDVQNGNVLNPAVFLSGNDFSEQPYILNWDYDGIENLCGTGTAATMYFRVKESANSNAELRINVNQRSTFDCQLKETPFRIENGGIYLNVLGDINYDKLVSVADAVLLCRYISEDVPEPFRDEVKYDINGDGLLTVLDVTAILRILMPDSQNKVQ